MDDSQTFWWIKVPIDFYSLPEVDWLREQKNGCEYIVLYQMLCHLGINTDGALIRHIGKMEIPYDAKKIAEVTKFSFDTVVVALELLEKTKLIYYVSYNDIQVIQITNFNKLVGSETKGAERKRLQRAKKKQLQQKSDAAPLSGQNEGQAWDNVPQDVPRYERDNVPTEYRDQSIEFRDKNLEKDTLQSSTYINNNKYHLLQSTLKDTNSLKDTTPVDKIVDKSVDNLESLTEELQQRRFSKKAILAFLTQFPPETIRRQIINFDLYKKSITSNREGWFYTALKNDFDIPARARPDPDCPECHGKGKIAKIVGDTKEVIYQNCSCIEN